MFVYCLNNPVIFGDSEGTAAILLIDTDDSAGGNGHVSILLQDSEGEWHFFSFASAWSNTITVGISTYGLLFHGILGSSKGAVTYKDLGSADAFDLSTYDGLEQFLLASNEIPNTVEKWILPYI